MKQFLSLLVLTGLAVWQPAAAAVSPDTVVATINGRKLTAGDIDSALLGAPPQLQKSLSRNRRTFVRNYALVTKLAEMAEKEGLAKKSPYKEQLDWARFQTLWQAAVDYRSREFQSKGLDEKAVEQKLRDWMDNIRSTVTVSLANKEYFSDPSKISSLPPETVIATVNGKELTADRLKEILTGTSPDMRERFRKNSPGFLGAYGFMSRLAEYAEENKLASRSPYKEQLEWVRLNQLMQAELNSYTDSINIGPEQEKEYYAAHKQDFVQAKVKVLYLSFAPEGGPATGPDGKKVLTEAEAKAKIESLRKQIAEGADFVELVKKYSEDEVSRKNDGDFGTIRRSDKIPQNIRDVIFSLKAGEVSQPVRQPNGFYLFRVDEISGQSLDEVRQTLNREAKNAKFEEWFTSIRKSLDIKFENEEYFKQPAAE